MSDGLIDRFLEQVLRAKVAQEEIDLIMTLAGQSFNWEEDVGTLIELPWVYDGWSAVVLKDGTILNRWAARHDAAQPQEGYEHRYYETEQAIAEWKERNDGAQGSPADGE